MSRKSIAERLTRALRIPAPGRNSFVAAIEDSEHARMHALRIFDPAEERSVESAVAEDKVGQPLMAQMETQPYTDWTLSETSSVETIPMNDTIHEPSDRLPHTIADPETLDPAIIESVAKEVGKAMTFTIGLITMSKSPVDMKRIVPFVDQLAIRTNRTAYCIRANGPASQIESHPVSPSDPMSPQAFFETWNLSESKTGHSSALLHGLKQLPSLKGRYPLIVLDIGSCEHSWVEQLGRMCDCVYLVLPTHGTLAPSYAATRAKSLMRALVPIRGSWIAKVA